MGMTALCVLLPHFCSPSSLMHHRSWHTLGLGTSSLQVEVYQQLVPNLYLTVYHQTKRGKIYTIERGKICTLISFKTPFIIKFRHEKVNNK